VYLRAGALACVYHFPTRDVNIQQTYRVPLFMSEIAHLLTNMLKYAVCMYIHVPFAVSLSHSLKRFAVSVCTALTHTTNVCNRCENNVDATRNSGTF